VVVVLVHAPGPVAHRVTVDLQRRQPGHIEPCHERLEVECHCHLRRHAGRPHGEDAHDRRDDSKFTAAVDVLQDAPLCGGHRRFGWGAVIDRVAQEHRHARLHASRKNLGCSLEVGGADCAALPSSRGLELHASRQCGLLDLGGQRAIGGRTLSRRHREEPTVATHQERRLAVGGVALDDERHHRRVAECWRAGLIPAGDGAHIVARASVGPQHHSRAALGQELGGVGKTAVAAAREVTGAGVDADQQGIPAGETGSRVGCQFARLHRDQVGPGHVHQIGAQVGRRPRGVAAPGDSLPAIGRKLVLFHASPHRRDELLGGRGVRVGQVADFIGGGNQGFQPRQRTVATQVGPADADSGELDRQHDALHVVRAVHAVVHVGIAAREGRQVHGAQRQATITSPCHQGLDF